MAAHSPPHPVEFIAEANLIRNTLSGRGCANPLGVAAATLSRVLKSNPEASKAESPRQAMLKVMAMSQYGQPRYWAPYALVGDGGR